jgi:toxin ParE1/3/4
MISIGLAFIRNPKEPEKCQALADTPGIGVLRKEYHGLRKFSVGDYLIFYRQSQDDIEIIRILHGSRDIESIFNQDYP